MEKRIITEEEINRISLLTESEMLKESATWTPSQWAAYITKGKTFDDAELDRFIEEEIIER